MYLKNLKIDNFNSYITVNENINTLFDTVNQLTIDELDNFGWYLHENFFDINEDEDTDVYTKYDVITMLKILINEFENVEELNNFVSSLLNDLEYTDDAVNEGVSRRMLPSHLNHKRRKFMKKSKSVLRREKVKRKRLNRINRMKRRRYYRANKLKIKSYQKSRNAMIKKGRHIVKLRRRT